MCYLGQSLFWTFFTIVITKTNLVEIFFIGRQILFDLDQIEFGIQGRVRSLLT